MDNTSQKGLAIGLIVAVIVVVLVVAYSMSHPKGDDTAKTPMLQKVRECFSKINSKFGTIPLFVGDSSYTENKEAITLCLHDPQSGEPYDLNTIMYVALHELAHVITRNEHGHGTKFKANFTALLKKAAALGLYDPSKPIPANYCGIQA